VLDSKILEASGNSKKSIFH